MHAISMKNAYPVPAVEHSLDTLDIKRWPTSLEIPRGGIYKKRSTANKLRIDRREREREIVNRGEIAALESTGSSW